MGCGLQDVVVGVLIGRGCGFAGCCLWGVLIGRGCGLQDVVVGVLIGRGCGLQDVVVGVLIGRGVWFAGCCCGCVNRIVGVVCRMLLWVC